MMTTQETAMIATADDRAGAARYAIGGYPRWDMIANVVTKVRVYDQPTGAAEVYALAGTVPAAKASIEAIIACIRMVMNRLLLNAEKRTCQALLAAGKAHERGANGIEMTIERAMREHGASIVVSNPEHNIHGSVVGEARIKAADGLYPRIWNHVMVLSRDAAVTHRAPSELPGDVVNGWRVSTEIAGDDVRVVISHTERIEIVNPDGIGFIV